MRRVLCLHLPAYRIERALLTAGWLPRDASARAAVLAERHGAAMQVAACSQAAQQAGIRAGQSMAEARAIVPDLIEWPYDPARDAAELERLADWAQRFSPWVQPAQPDTILADVTGCERVFRGEAHIVRLAERGLAQMGYTARAAIADTLGAAWALAHAPYSPHAPYPPGAPHSPNDSERVVAPGVIESATDPLPLSTLRLSDSILAQLERVGIDTIGALRQMPPASLAARFGQEVVRRLEQLSGRLPEPIAPRRCVEPPFARMAFTGPTDRLKVLSAAADHLLEQLFRQLTKRVLALRQLRCVLYHVHAAPATFAVAFAVPTRSRVHVRSLLVERLEALRLPEGAIGMMLLAAQAVRASDRQSQLFEEGVGQDHRGADHEPAGQTVRLGEMMDRLVTRLGPEAVLRAEPVMDHQPEHAYRYVPVFESFDRTEAQRRRRRKTEPPPQDQGLSGPRPLQLWPEPQRVRAMAFAPDGPPVRFTWRGRDHTVAEACGPERLETGWWKGGDVQRDYYRVRAHTGQRFWMFRDRKSGEWYLHGCFD